MLSNTYKEIHMTPIHAYVFEIMSKCVFIEDILKSRCKFITLFGDYAQQKQVGWEVIFSKHGFAGSGACKPWRELKGSTLDFFCGLF